MKQLILKVSDTADRWTRLIAGLVLATLVVLVMFQVIARYIFLAPPVWSEELARYAMIWAGLLGASMSFKAKFDPALVQGEAAKAWLNFARKVISSLAILIYLLPILWFCVYGPGMRVLRGFLVRHMRTSAETLDFPTIYVAVSVPIALLLILLHLCARWAGDGENPDKET